MRFRALAGIALAVALAASAACGPGGLFRQYEYEEEMYVALDGRATLYVNTSIPALNALRGTSFDTSPAAAVDREKIRDYYSAPFLHVNGRVTTSRRGNRRFVHLRIDVDDIGRLGEAPPFAWSTYRFARDGDQYAFHQTVGPSAGRDVGNVGWTGREIVAFRLHLPSKITFHNTRRVQRGNILVWEQPLVDRQRSVPVTLDARMETQSILNRTLWLFGTTFAAVAVAFGVVIWWILRRGREREGPDSWQRVDVPRAGGTAAR